MGPILCTIWRSHRHDEMHNSNVHCWGCIDSPAHDSQGRERSGGSVGFACDCECECCERAAQLLHLQARGRHQQAENPARLIINHPANSATTLAPPARWPLSRHLALACDHSTSFPAAAQRVAADDGPVAAGVVTAASCESSFAPLILLQTLVVTHLHQVGERTRVATDRRNFRSSYRSGGVLTRASGCCARSHGSCASAKVAPTGRQQVARHRHKYKPICGRTAKGPDDDEPAFEWAL